MSVTRQEVEEELERKSASIVGSITRIKKELSLPTEPLKSAIRKHPAEMLAATVAAGLAIGWAVSGKRKKNKKKGMTPSPKATSRDLRASEFLHFVRAGRASGLSEEEAVARALAASNPPVNHQPTHTRNSLADRLSDYLVDMAEAMIKTGMRVAAREAASWVADSVRRDRPKESQ